MIFFMIFFKDFSKFLAFFGQKVLKIAKITYFDSTVGGGGEIKDDLGSNIG